jgi:hypothetical protein
MKMTKKKKRHPNPNLAKIHYSKTVEEIASLFDVCRATVRNWIKHGLPTISNIRPTLILGQDLRAFLQARRMKNKRKCQIGEMYCFKCRAPKTPAIGMVDYEPKTATTGNLIGMCPDCGTIMNRRASLAKLDQFRGHMDVTLPQA